MAITTIMGRLAAPAGDGGAAPDAAADGELAALFAALLQAASGGVTVPVTPGAPGTDEEADEAVAADPALAAEPEGSAGDHPAAADIAAMLGLVGATPTTPDVAAPVVGQVTSKDGEDRAAANVTQADATGPARETGGPAPRPGAPQLQDAAAAGVQATGGTTQTPGSRPMAAGAATPTADATGDAASTVAAPVPAAEPATREPVTARPASAQSIPPGMTTGPGEAAATTAVAGGRASAPGGTAAGTAPTLVDRVMEAIDSLENAPPPRRIRVEVGDLRVAVSLRSDGVHVAVDGDSLPSPTWDADLTTALESRGLTLAGSGTQDDEGREQRPTPEQDAPADAPATPRPTTADQGDDALRL